MAHAGSTWSEAVAATVRAELARRRIRAAALMEVLGLGRTATYDRVNGVVPFDTRELLLIAAFLDMTAEDLVRDADRSSHPDRGGEEGGGRYAGSGDRGTSRRAR